jgi:hypothetical protein
MKNFTVYTLCVAAMLTAVIAIAGCAATRPAAVPQAHVAASTQASPMSTPF